MPEERPAEIPGHTNWGGLYLPNGLQPQLEHGRHGALLANGVEIASTRQCPHCGGHFISVKGSGVRRQWCTRCSDVCCGQDICAHCIPFEAKLEYAEGALNKYTAEIQQLEAAFGRYW